MSVRRVVVFVSLASLFFLCCPLAAAQRGAAERLSEHRLVSRVLGEERVYRVHVPPGYATGTKRYPVLYLLDGEALLEHTAATVDYLSRQARIPELIVVGIHNTDRNRDLTPTHANVETPSGVDALPTSGGGNRFLVFLQRDLMPEIERKFRTQPYRVLAGHSLGGLFTLHVFTTAPETFDAYLAVSPSFFWDDNYLVRKLTKLVEERRGLKRSVFFSLGLEPTLSPAFEEFRTILSNANVVGLEWASRKFEDEDHGSVVLVSHYYGLRWIFSAWPLPVDPLTGRFLGGIPELKAHFENLTERFGYPVLPPEVSMNQLGYLLIGEKRFNEAIQVFEMNVRNYPRSANAYDSLGDGLQAAGRLEEARDSYRKAVQIGKMNKDQYLAVYRDHLKAVEKKIKTTTPAK